MRSEGHPGATTLREAFRLLSHERLLEHRFHRGVFVRVPTCTDVADLFLERRLLESRGGLTSTTTEPSPTCSSPVRGPPPISASRSTSTPPRRSSSGRCGDPAAECQPIFGRRQT